MSDVLKPNAEYVTSGLLVQYIVVRQIYFDVHLHTTGISKCLRVFLRQQVQYNRL
jgi:hypothetical protein